MGGQVAGPEHDRHRNAGSDGTAVHVRMGVVFAEAVQRRDPNGLHDARASGAAGAIRPPAVNGTLTSVIRKNGVDALASADARCTASLPPSPGMQADKAARAEADETPIAS